MSCNLNTHCRIQGTTYKLLVAFCVFAGMKNYLSNHFPFFSDWLEAAVVKEGPSAMNVSAGHTVVVRCRAFGDPIPRIRY